MSRREFTSQKALQDHAEQTGKVCVVEGMALRQPALLIPKAVLKAPRVAELPFREALGIKREHRQLRRSK